MKKVLILGSTGSIGKAALEIAGAGIGDIEIVGLAAGRNVDLLEKQLINFPKARFTVRDDDILPGLLSSQESFAGRLVGTGSSGIENMIRETDPDLVVNALVGIAGLMPTITSLECGCSVALANKESLVTGGGLVMGMAGKDGERIIPVDSEHFSLSRCLSGNRDKTTELVLTASGGPFFKRDPKTLADVTLEQVLAHPTWNMGKKVTVDSAHMVNKGLEVIEAHWLFNFPIDDIKVVIHPQSIVHSLIRMRDGSLLAHLSPPDMRLPIMNAFFFPEVREFPWNELSFDELCSLEFHPLERGRFRGFELTVEAMRTGGSAPVVLNAADEMAVSNFLSGRIGFLTIIEWIEEALSAHSPAIIESVGDVLEADRWTKEFLLDKYGGIEGVTEETCY
ncbi:MAG: 1-deoxy-D-xylulose-5-phosphate reductoisomerase [Bacteroidales bacterium]|nr:1-deoxy-D-xylulose-5-phosphate reductoisomerase [Candidatus Latescibacterota bacterium]